MSDDALTDAYDVATWLLAQRAYTLYVAHLAAAGYPPLPRFEALPQPEQAAFCALVQALTLGRRTDAQK